MTDQEFLLGLADELEMDGRDGAADWLRDIADRITQREELLERFCAAADKSLTSSIDNAIALCKAGLKGEGE
jgi:hypothetical protein